MNRPARIGAWLWSLLTGRGRAGVGHVECLVHEGDRAHVVLDDGTTPGGLPPGDPSPGMSSEPPTGSARPGSNPAEDRVRLELKPRSSSGTGFVDGGWWPRSRDLPAELPDLLAVLEARLGSIERVGYRISEWEPTTVRRMVVDGGLVHLGGYRGRPVGTVDVIAVHGRVTLLVVPPDTAGGTAHRALQVSGQRDNADPVADLLAPAEDGAPP